MGQENLYKAQYFSYSHQIIMDFETVATKENTNTTAANDDAADLTENDDAVDISRSLAQKRTFIPIKLSKDVIIFTCCH